MVIQIAEAIMIQDVEREWNILALGDEIKLLKGLRYKNINETTTIFYFDYQAEYESAINFQAKDVSKVPIEKTTYSETVHLSKNTIDLSKDNSLTIHYKPNESASFKLGWETLLIDSAGGGGSLGSEGSDNIVLDSQDNLHIVYAGDADDLYYSNSSDWTNFSTKEIKDLISTRYVGIVIDSNDNLFVYLNPSSNLSFYNSSDYGYTWNYDKSLSHSNDYDSISCSMDSGDIIHCCFITSSDSLIYWNSSNKDFITVNGNSADDSDSCDIELDYNNCIFIVASGTDGDDVDIWSPCLNGWGDANRVSVHESTSSSIPVITADNQNGLHISFIESLDLWYSNSSDGGNTWSSQEVDASESDTPCIAVNENGSQIYILYTDGGVTGNLVISNSSDNGLTWEVDTLLINDNLLACSIAQSSYPSSNSLDNKLHYVASYNDLYYGNITIHYVAPITVYGNVTNFTVTLPNGQTEAVFTALNKSHKYIEPTGQTETTAFFNITSKGNASLNVTHLLNQTLPNDVVYMFNTEYDSNTATVLEDFVKTIYSPLLENESISIWIWTNITDITPQTIGRIGNISVFNNT